MFDIQTVKFIIIWMNYMMTLEELLILQIYFQFIYFDNKC